jgi:Rod binding domain-containing protein
MTAIRPTTSLATGPESADQRLRRVAHEFEAVFMAQVFREMRATLSPSEEGQAEEMFTTMLDDAMAGQAAQASQRGLGEALYRQLAARLQGPPAAQGGHD